MSELESGFSFGTRPPDSDDPVDEVDEVEVVDVAGEPVTRNEGRRLGVEDVDKLPGVRLALPQTHSTRMHRMTGISDPELEAQMRQAWSHLEKNEVEEALTLAQEMVWKHPNLLQPKLIIARCFISLKEFDKALAILASLPESDKDSEVNYYIGLCHSRLGRVREALDALTKSRDAATDAYARKRSGDLILHLQGEQIACPVCGKKVLYDSMVEMGDRTICADCADEEAAMAAAADDHSSSPSARRRRRLRPPMSWYDILARLFIALALLFIAGVLLYWYMPDTYRAIVDRLPFIGSSGAVSVAPRPQERQPASADLRVIPTMKIDSPPLERVIAGVGIRHRIYVDGVGRADGEYNAAIEPKPAGPYAMDRKSGIFTWTPSPEDAGRDFNVTFNAVFNDNIRSTDQVNRVRVSPGLRAAHVGQLPPPDPSAALRLLPGNLAGKGAGDVILISGEYWRGMAAILSPDPDGNYAETARIELSGRPAGVGVVMAGDERWLAVADYWNSRIRHFALRDGALSEMGVSIDLPGRPILAGFDASSSVSAVLCRVSGGLRAMAFRQEGQLVSRLIGSWTVPDAIAWRAMFVLAGGAGEEATVALAGGSSASNSLLVLRGGDQSGWSAGKLYNGTLLDAVHDPRTRTIAILSRNGNGYEVSVVSYDADLKFGQPVIRSAGTAPEVLALMRATGGKTADALILAPAGAELYLSSPEYADSRPLPVALPTPPVPFGTVATLAGAAGYGDKALFLDAGGGIWTAGLAE